MADGGVMGVLLPATSLVRSDKADRPGVRAATQSMHRLSLAELARGAALYPDEGQHAERPRTRAECPDTSDGPCPWVSCKYHLYLDVNERTGSIKLNFPGLEVWELPDTCALDVAERSSKVTTLERVGEAINVTRERVRQIEAMALRKARAACNAEGEYQHVEAPPVVRREQPTLRLVPTATWERVLYTLGWRRVSGASLMWYDTTGRKVEHLDAYAHAVSAMQDEVTR